MAEETLEQRLAKLYAKKDHIDQFNEEDVRTLVDAIRDAREHGGTASVDITPISGGGGYTITITDSEGTEHTATVKDGGDAYEVYVSTVPQDQTPMSKTEWLASLKGDDGHDGAPGNNGHNPCLGRYNALPTVADLPETPRVGDYIYVDDKTDPTNVVTTLYKYDATSQTGFDQGTVVDVSNETFGSGQSLPTVAIKDLNGNNDPNAAGVLSAEAGKDLNEKLYGSHDDSSSEEITLSSSTAGRFYNASGESGNAYVSMGNDRKGMITPEAFASIKSYKFLRVTQGENSGGVTFVKKEAPSKDMTYQQLVEGGYLSEVHDSYNNVVIDCPANSTTDIVIPDDAHTAYFIYRKATDGSGVDTTYRKPTMVVGYGLVTVGDIQQIWNEIREIEEGGGGSEEPIDGADILDGTVSGEKLIHTTEEYMSFSLIDYDSLVGGTIIGSTGGVATVSGANYRATNFIKLMGKKVFWYGMGSYGIATNGGALYDENKNVLRVFRLGGINNFDPNNTEDPNYVEGAAYIRLTLTGAGSLHYCVYAKSDGTNPVADQSNITTNMIKGYYRDQVIHHANINITFPKENVPELIPALSMSGQSGFTKTVAAVGPGQSATYVEVADTEFPSYLKCCHTISFKGFLGIFGENDIIRFGINRNSTTGKVVEIDGTQVKIKRYDANNGYVTNVEFAHELTISDFVMCEVGFSWFGGKIRLITSSGSFVQEWQNTQYSYAGNAQVNYGRAFLEPSIALTSVKISQSSDRFMKPVWVIGDSYTSMANARWTYQLINNFGIDGFLLDGYAGAPSENMVPELKRLLQYGTPKYLVWCLGMNDGPTIWKYCSTEVEMMCRERGITLVYQTIPRPSSDQGEGIGKKGIINNYIKESGYRYIDVFDAVTENRETGAWYSGMLDDGTHPTELGAKVIAGQVLVDFPEIANYK